jgi:predicted PurR-regulated permease PerM
MPPGISRAALVLVAVAVLGPSHGLSGPKPMHQVKRGEGGERDDAELKRSLLAEHVESISGRAAVFALILIGVVLHEIQTILIPFVIAGVAAYAATPLIEWVTRRGGLPRALSAVIVFLAIVGAAAAMIRLGLSPLMRSALLFVGDMQGAIQRSVQEIIGDKPFEVFGQSFSAPEIAARAVQALREWLSQSENVMTLATAGAGVFFGAILTTVVLFYFLVSGPRIADGLFWLIPPKQRVFVLYLWSRLDPALKRYFVGLAIVVLYAVCAAYIGLGLVLGIRHALFLSLMTGILEIIPFVGPITAAVVAGLVALKQATSVWNILAYAIYATMLRVSIDQFLAPIVLGRAGNVHPTLVIFCFAAGGILFGFVGVILAVPVALSIKVVLETIYDQPSRRPG